MNFLQAVEIAENKADLIGKKTENGGVIDEIIIYPNDAELLKKYKREYITTLCPHLSIRPFIDMDIDFGVAVVIDKERIRKENAIILCDI